MSEHRWMGVPRAALVALLTLAAYDSIVAARLQDSHGGNYSGFLHISQAAFDRNPLLNRRDDVRRRLVLQEKGGYDGEYMYFATFDPVLRAYRATPATYRQIMDVPPYRYGRIGFSLLTRVLSAGRWQWYPATMVWLILGALSLTAFLLARMAERHGLSPGLGLLVLAVPGFWQSLQSGLPEPLAAAALVGGVIALSESRWWPAAVLFALSLLVRETGVIAVGCCVLAAAMRSTRRREIVFVGMFAVGVAVLWRLYVAWVLFPDWGVEGFFYHPADLGRPFGGFLDLWRAIARGQYYPGQPELSRAGIVYPVLLIGGLVLTAALAVTAPSAVNISAFAYALIAISLNFGQIWGLVGNGQRGTYELFVMLALSCMAIRTYPALVRRGLAAFWVTAAIYVFFGAFDASYIRAALPIPF